MKIRALKKFEGLRDNERSKIEGKEIYPKAGDEWEVTEERANFLKSHGVVEIVEEKPETIVEEIIEQTEEKPKEKKTKSSKKKKTYKK